MKKFSLCLIIFNSLSLLFPIKSAFSEEGEIFYTDNDQQFDEIYNEKIGDFKNRDKLLINTNLKNSKFKNCTVSGKPILLDPIPKLSNLTTQDNFGVCYAAASLFSLEEAVSKVEKVRPSYSLSNSLCRHSGRTKSNAQTLKINGGQEFIFMMNLMAEKKIISKMDDPVPLSKLSEDPDLCKFCTDEDKKTEGYKKLQQKLLAETLKKQEAVKPVSIPPFTLNIREVDSKIPSKSYLVNEIQNLLINEKSLISLELLNPGHLTNIFGSINYLCEDIKGKMSKVTTYLEIDPNGFKREILADEFNKRATQYFTLSVSPQKSERKNKILFPYRLTDLASLLSSDTFLSLLKEGVFVLNEERILENLKQFILQKNTDIVTTLLNMSEVNPSLPTAKFNDLSLIHEEILSLIGKTAKREKLDLTILNKMFESIEKLPKEKRFLNTVDKENFTPLCMAIQLGQAKLVDKLIKLGADQKLKCTSLNLSPIELVFRSQIETSEREKMVLLLAKGIVEPIAYSLSLISQFKGSALEELIKSGFNINNKDKDQFTLLAHLILHNKIENLKILLEQGADLFFPITEQNYPLFSYFIGVENIEEKTLLEALKKFYLYQKDNYLKNINLRDNNPNLNTPLCEAINHHRPSLVEYILDHGGDPEIPCEKEARSPLCQILSEHKVDLKILKIVYEKLLLDNKLDSAMEKICEKLKVSDYIFTTNKFSPGDTVRTLFRRYAPPLKK